MRNRRESIRVGALVALLTIVGVAGGAWTDEVSAQERLILSRPAVVAVQTTTGLPGGKDMLIAVGTLQFLGVIAFEVMTLSRRRARWSPRRVIRFSPAPTPCTFPAPGSTSRTRRAA